MTLLVRNEADVIGATIAYHLSRGVDHVIVTDNGSTDATRSIVEEFAAAGSVTLIDEPGDDYSQSVWVTRMARAAAEMGADWVINGDADELWWPLAGDLKTVLGRVPQQAGAVVVQRANLLPLRTLGGHPFERMICRERRSFSSLGNPLPGKTAHRAARDVKVHQGNHTVESAALGPAAPARAMTIFHYPYRSYAQLERKIATGGAAYARNTVLPQWVGADWRKLYEMLQAGTLRAWYEALPHADDAEQPARIARGDVVPDARVAHYLRDYVFDVSPGLAAPVRLERTPSTGR